MKTIIYAKKNNAKHKHSFLVLQCAFAGKQYQYSTGTKIDDSNLKKYWKGGRVLDKARDLELFKLNAEFDRLKTVAHNAYKESPQWSDIRTALDRASGKEVVGKPIPISGFYE